MSFLKFLGDILKKIKDRVPLNKLEMALIRNVIKKDASRAMLFAGALTQQYKAASERHRVKARQARAKLDIITTNAINRIVNDEEPFSREEVKTLVEVFNDLGFDGNRVARAYVSNFTLVFGMGVKDTLNKLAEKEASTERIGLAAQKEETEKGKLKA